MRYFIILFSALFFLTISCQGQKIRPPLVAGSFYPADPAVLNNMLNGFFANVRAKRISEPIIALIVPHAGYPYAGHVAVEAYAQLKGRDIRRVVIIAPSHFDYFRGCSVFNGDGYATPLGTVTVDKDFARSLAKKSDRIFLSDRGHKRLPNGRGEHSLEVQLPYLQKTLPSFTLVPVIMGEQSYQTCRALARALDDLIKDSHTLVIASSDLSHYHPYQKAEELDQKVIRAVEEWDYYNLSRNLQSRLWEACGGGPIVATMMVAEHLGATEARLLKYANSGDVEPYDRSRVVGYAAMALIKSPAHSKSSEFKLTPQEQQELLAIARKAVEMKVAEEKLYQPKKPKDQALLTDRGAFVTLTEQGNLRGCIGYTAPIKPLYLTVRDVAVEAASRDPRFQPVRKDELKQLKYEISVLSPFRHVDDVKRIKIGRDGLLIQEGGAVGLLLPQVPVGQGWDRITFLRQTCRKAGLPKDAWQDKQCDLFRFTAFVFGEH